MDIKAKIAEINDLVSPVIDDLLAQDVEDYTKEVALYQCRMGGKRIRPALVVLTGQVFGANTDDLLRPAAAIEILHNSTLIIDDIIDHSDFRRNELTCWKKYGKSIAECSSFMYLSSVYSGLSHSNKESALIDLYSNTLKIIIDGEIKDILFERSGREDENFITMHRYKNIGKDEYFKMIYQKTAVLLSACCKAGAIIAGADNHRIEKAGDFGTNIGMAFQVRDDILDIFGDEKEFGKKIGKDIIEKKMGNYVVLSALDGLDQSDCDRIREVLEGNGEVTDEDVLLITDLINKTDARQVAEDTSNSFIKKAFDALSELPQNDNTSYLEGIANYIVNRKN